MSEEKHVGDFDTFLVPDGVFWKIFECDVSILNDFLLTCKTAKVLVEKFQNFYGTREGIDKVCLDQFVQQNQNNQHGLCFGTEIGGSMLQTSVLCG